MLKHKNKATFIKLVVVGLVITFTIITLNKEVMASNIVIEVDETDKWIRHEIAVNINRGNSSMTIADINGDDKTDVIICLGKRNIHEPSDGIWRFESSSWTTRRISDPDFPIRWSLALTVGDIDNDGDMDVVTAPDHDHSLLSNSMIWWENKLNVSGSM
jgi:hypothetical protein